MFIIAIGLLIVGFGLIIAELGNPEPQGLRLGLLLGVAGVVLGIGLAIIGR